jgi:polysaccharide biosynthesis protein EpsC
MLLVLLVIGSRVFFRVVGDAAGRHRRTDRRVLIYGAGDGGALVLRELRNNVSYGFEPVGFIDDDPGKHKTSMLRLPVLGGLERLPHAIATHRPYAIILSSGKITAERRVELVRICQESGTLVLMSRFSLEELTPLSA